MSSVWSIRRSAGDAKLTGLCGGVAQHWGVDPLLVRVGWVLLALSGGVGLVLYLAGWLLIPVEGRQQSTLDDLTSGASARWSREVRLVLVIIACIVTFAVFGSLTPFSLWPAAILAAIWYFGYYKNRSRQPAEPPPPTAPPIIDPPAAPPFRYPGPATPFTEAAEAWRQRMDDHVRGSGPRLQTPPAAAAVPAPQPAASVPSWPLLPPPGAPTPPELRDPEPTPTNASADEIEHAAYLAVPDPVGLYSDPDKTSAVAAPSRRARAQTVSARRLRLVSVIVLGLVLAGLGVADALGATVTLTVYFAAALAVIGLTLIAATWLGRARGILPIGVLVLVALASASVVSPGGIPRAWSHDVRYASLAQLPAAGDRVEIGALTVDLSGLAVTRDASYTAHVDVGRLIVRTPTTANVRVRYAVDEGVVLRANTTVVSGSELRGVIEPTPLRAGKPTLTLDLSANLGEVRVQP